MPEQSALELHWTHWPELAQIGAVVGQLLSNRHSTHPSVELHIRPLGQVPFELQGTAGMPPVEEDPLPPPHPRPTAMPTSAIAPRKPRTCEKRFLFKLTRG